MPAVRTHICIYIYKYSSTCLPDYLSISRSPYIYLSWPSFGRVSSGVLAFTPPLKGYTVKGTDCRWVDIRLYTVHIMALSIVLIQMHTGPFLLSLMPMYRCARICHWQTTGKISGKTKEFASFILTAIGLQYNDSKGSRAWMVAHVGCKQCA